MGEAGLCPDCPFTENRFTATGHRTSLSRTLQVFLPIPGTFLQEIRAGNGGAVDFHSPSRSSFSSTSFVGWRLPSFKCCICL